MLIQCTKKLLDYLKVNPISQQEEDPLFSWHANLMTINRRKAIVLVNDNNRYVITLYGVTAKHVKKLDTLILESIQKTFLAEGIKEEVIEQYIQHAPDFTFAKTKDKTSVARMNKSCETIYIWNDLLDDDHVEQLTFNKKASRYLITNGKNNYIYPNQQLYVNLEEFAGQPVLQTKAVRLHVKLNLERGHVLRKLTVPLRFTFHQLHRTLQIAFDWEDYHLHEFYIYDDQTTDATDSGWSTNYPSFGHEKKKLILNLVSQEETLDYKNDIPVKLEKGIQLSTYLPTYKHMDYVYDFGDDWLHRIEVEAVIDDYDKNYPICMEGEGNTPPEDVGGIHGYERYLNILADPEHPEHRHMLEWGKGQSKEKFDLEKVNRLLKAEF
ncbi:plasmid pRiA4b ORF-3 family protein [Oceanobacillus saliphilus]|uniref:plasmid pRiA4b ORF-3 family protein n=1 Tax=Oceanobacillus saliphilus TaxID=2925834 RepID=UPI00201D3152|nr:plasmid pRiA4b ORF-3 family protein [Oceanobacillus saliphilus]